MTYENDPLLPRLQSEIQSRSQTLKGLSADEESEMLRLTSEQRKLVADTDRKAKNEYLSRKD